MIRPSEGLASNGKVKSATTRGPGFSWPTSAAQAGVFSGFQYPTPPLRIANRTVAEEYFAVSEKVEALYDAPKTLPAGAEGAEMRKLRAQMHQRMLGNGYCARPVGLDCHFESICESCTFFQTTIEFRPTLQAQRDDAAGKGQIGRQKIFDGLLARLQESAS